MTKYEKIAISSTSIIAVTGLYCGLETEGINFARSGALIVIVGVIFGLFDLPSRLSEIDILANNETEKARLKAITSIESTGGRKEDAEIAADAAIKDIISKINSLARKKRNQLVLIEACIVVIGTLIWGFGDLINTVCCCSH